jgi:hypothetical protein
VRIQNRSAFVSTAKILPLVDFVSFRTKFSSLATLVLVDGGCESVTGGKALKTRLDGDPISLVAPSMITLYLSRGLSYPFSTEHEIPAVAAKVGEVVLNSWEEEIVFVLAHEAAHIDAFHGKGHTDIVACELDAEKFAVKTLKAYRRSQEKTDGKVDAQKHSRVRHQRTVPGLEG